MICPSCAHENRPGAKFCEECAGPLKRVCTSCGSELRPTAKFCDECAAPVPGAASAARASAPADTRKVVTIVFADLVGSTALHERLDPESARRFMESYYAAMRGAVESHGGTVTQLLGDGVKAVFGIPRVAEDDAIRAVRAAAAMQEAFRTLADAQRGAVGATGLRVAVNTGEVVANDATEIIGDPVNVAARLQEQGKDGDVVVGESTHRLVSTLVTLELLGSFALKGRSEAVKAYRVVSLDRPAGAATAPFVGRDEEIARLASVYATAIEKPAAGLAVLVGSPGLGKSRLIDEFARRSGETATVIRAHCDAAGGATFAPLADALREGLGIESSGDAEALRTAIEAVLPEGDTDRARIAGGVASLLAASPASPEETFFVVRRLLGALAKPKPVVLVIDDLHWAEPLLLDLVEHLIQWGGGVPLFVLIGARPELRDLRSSLVTPGSFVSDVVTLSGLDAGAAMRLAANVVGASDLPAAIAAKVLATSEGNPLFVGELVRMLVEEGALTREGDRWVVGANLAALEMPPTIHALLAARIERLRPEDRSVLERAAVVGRHFSRSAIAALMPGGADDLDARLEALRRSELIERDTGWMIGEPVLRFHHVLIRDAAYRRLLKGTRAELHAKLADWIEAQTGDAAEHDETIGWHLEQAHQFLRELGPLDATGRQLGERAATRLAAAGRRSLARDDLAVAADLLGRAIERLDANDPARADLALDWCEALLAAGDVGPAAAAIAELGRFTADSERLRAWHTCFVGQHTVLTAPSALHATTGAVAAAAGALTAQGDAAGEAKAHYVHALALSRLGKVGDCEAALDRALAAARRAGDRRRANTVLAIAPLAALWGPSPVTRASGRCLDVVRVLRITQGAPAVEAVALSCQGVLEALRGRTEAAGRMIASARKMVEELGITQRLLEADVAGGLVALLEGDAIAAERSLRGAYDGLRDLGLGIDAARAAALLARALLAQGRADEAEALSHESEALAGDDLKAAIAWRGVRAEALARRGEHVEAIALATRAVELAAATDALLDHADARLALAAALRAAGRGREADAEEGRARELWRAKGATLLAERAVQAAARDARFEAPAVSAAKAAPTRHVRANAATALAERVDAAFAANDLDAFAALLARSLDFVDHPVGATYGHANAMAGVRAQLRAREPRWRQEPLATLGNRLGLFRRAISALETAGTHFDVGASEKVDLVIAETDGAGATIERLEIFGEDKLADAVVRLYERHFALLPEGPERDRAAGTAESAAVILLASADPDRYPQVVAPDFESIDYRPLRTWSLRGGTTFVEHMRALRDVADDVAMTVDEVLALAPDRWLVRRMHAGTARAGGGAYERLFLSLFATDAAGRVVRAEWFDTHREAEALARFEALAALAAKPAAARRVRANAATAIDDRFEAAFAAHDVDAARACFDPNFAEVDHSLGSELGHDSTMAGLGYVFGSRNLVLENERLATLGDSLLLARRHYRGTGFADGEFETGDRRHVQIALEEAGDQGRFVRAEVFAPDRLGDALVRLYERYAERLPDGPERVRAEATARSRVALLKSYREDPEAHLGPVLSADFVAIDHRHLSTWSLRGASAYVEHLRALRQVAEDIEFQQVDILALTPHAQLTRVLHTGTDRASGGVYERPFLSLFASDADGRLARAEWFDADREAEALARFEALVAEPAAAARRVRANAARASVERFVAALEARDTGAFPPLFDDALCVIHHPSGSTYGRREMLATWRSALRAERLGFRRETLATLGDSLVLSRQVTAVAGLRESHLADFGATEVDEISLVETDAGGRWIHVELFAPDRLGDALVRLYALHAERLPEGAAHAAATTTARIVAAMLTTAAEPTFAESVAPGFEAVDHRLVGHEGVGADALARGFEAWRDLTDDVEIRTDDVLAATPGALLRRSTSAGVLRASGGRFERTLVMLSVFAPDGRVARTEIFDAGQEAEAIARFDALVGRSAAAPASHPFDNAASRADRLLFDRFNARDWPGIEALAAPDLVFDERRRMLHNRCGRAVWLEQFRVLFDVPASHFATKLLATRGDRLALSLHRFAGEVAGGGGPLAMDDHLVLHEVDRAGRIVAIVLFDLEDEGAAHAELDARFEAGEAATSPPALAAHVATNAAMHGRDWLAVAAQCAPTFRMRDHRLLGWGAMVNDADTFVRVVRSAVELAPDSSYRHDHVRICPRGTLAGIVLCGTRDGGAFETPLLRVTEVDEQGRILCHDTYDESDLDRAFARFAELAAPEAAGLGRFENAASRAWRAVNEAWSVRDRDRFEALHAAFQRYHDHRRLFQLDLDRAGFLDFTRPLLAMRAGDASLDLVATRGERLALMHSVMRMEDEAVGPSTIESLMMIEVDARGAITAYDRWDLADLDAAHAALEARFAADPGAARGGAVAGFSRAIAARDWDAVVSFCAPSFVEHDHRSLKTLGTTRGAEAWMGNFRALVELAPDTIYRSLHVRTAERGFLSVGTWQGSREGGGYEIPVFAVLELDAQGAMTRADLYEPDQQEQALARFAALKGRDADASAEPFANAASRLVERGTQQLWRARDWDGIVAMISPAVRMDDRRRLIRLEIGYDAFLAQFRMIFDQPGSRWRSRLVATRGERLALCRMCFEADVAEGGGPLAIDEHWSLVELDAEGRIAAFVTFDLDEEDAAYAELDARFAADPSAGHGRAVASFVHAISARDWDAVAALCSRTFVHRDHRRLAVLGTTHDREAWAQLCRGLVEIAPDAIYRGFHVRSAARGFLSVGGWQGSRDGGRFEIPQISVVEVDARCAWTRVGVYEPEQIDQALARFEELSGRAPEAPAPSFENAASAIMEPFNAAVVANDWARYEALLSEAFRGFDRRRMVLLDFDRDAQLAFARELAEGRRARGESTTLATRGERLALIRLTFVFEDAHVGPSEIVSLVVTEVDASGRIAAYVRFDDDDLDAAHEELEARYDAAEAALHPRATAVRMAQRRPYYERDWDAFAATHAPDLVCHDHRILGWGTLRGADAFVHSQQALVELAPDTRVRNTHVATTEHGYLVSALIAGTRDGGAFELAFLRVSEIDAAGRLCRIDLYDPGDDAAARARFAELDARDATGLGPFENDASHAWRRVIDAWRARDPARFEALHPRALRYRDQRRLFQLDLDRQGFLDFTRPLLTMRSAGASIDLLATRGERLALLRFTLTMEDETVGPSAIDSLLLVETDEHRAIAAYDRWDLDDREAAWAELDARFAAGEAALGADRAAAPAFGAALARRDWDAVAACFAPQFVGPDHRLVGWGTVHGPAELVRTLQEMVALASDARMQMNHLRSCKHGSIADVTWVGTRDGGAFEIPFVNVTELDANSRFVRVDFYDPHHLDRALGRFEEIRASERREGFASGVRPNLATAAMARNWTLFDTVDLAAAQQALDAARARYAPDFVWDDRRPLVGLSGGLDLMVASARERLASGARHQQRTIVDTAGDRVAIGRVLWAGGPEDGRFEVEFLVVAEVNEAGLFTAHVFFEPDDTRAAQREAWARWAAIDPAVAPWVELLDEITDAWNAHDVARFRACLGDDFVIDDHRLAGLGRIEDVDAYVDSHTALWELAPDQRIELGQLHAVAPHGVVLTFRRSGTLESGGAFENDYAWLALASNGRFTRWETFEIDALDAALARLEALRPDPLRAPETTAIRMRERHRDAFVARDWDAMRGLTDTDFVYEDRGKRALVRGDVEAWITSQHFTTQPGFRADTALIGTLGDRIVLDQVRWFGEPGGDAFEFGRVRLLEVGADGLLRAVLFFDPEDRSAASAEGLARFAAGEAAGSAGATPLTALSRALLERDWEAVRACFAPDLVVVDHRPLSLGTLDREPWIASLQAVDELGDGVVWEVFRVLVCGEQGFVKGVRRLGTIAGGGGPFENEVYAAALVADGRIQRYEVFGEADAERAVARFAELCAEGSA